MSSRLRNFTVFTRVQLEQVEEMLSGLTDEAQSTGWHRTWSAAAARVRGGTEAIVFAGKDRKTPLLVISKLNLESICAIGQWSSAPIKCAGVTYWASRNIKDFYWSFVDGSDMEVPYRYTRMQLMRRRKNKLLLNLRRKLGSIAFFSKQPVEED